MSFASPAPPASTSDERDVLLGYIRWQREQVVATAAGLTDEQLRWRPEDRLIPIGGIINHLTHMEWRWVEGRYLGSEFPPRTDEFNLDASARGAGLIEAYWQQGQTPEAVGRAGR